MKKHSVWMVLIFVGFFRVFSVSAQEGVAGPGYLIGPEDVLHISVWRDESLTRQVVVRPDGMISFPLVGDIRAEERTVDEIKNELIRRLAPFMPNATVSVAVEKINSYKIYVLGKVNRPGEYLVGRPTDILQALSLAGGLTPYAAENNIRLVRREKGGQKSAIFRYGEVVKGENLEQNIVLKRGDVVIVP
ncbi:MAG: polysaccharide biosynthesis/export family protein [Candidatus Manganitrophus sp. SB1]|nr:polysaccharide biosynthesis/export family protein [Candidatus Manganitrophus morganii]